nr:MAG TPA: hypothetical protein [Caudoviricetes sp.]
MYTYYLPAFNASTSATNFLFMLISPFDIQI